MLSVRLRRAEELVELGYLRQDFPVQHIRRAHLAIGLGHTDRLTGDSTVVAVVLSAGSDGFAVRRPELVDFTDEFAVVVVCFQRFSFPK